MSTTILALILGLGLLARFMLNLHNENVRLRSARRRTARLIRRCRRERDFARADFCSAIETSVELQREIDEWESGVRRAKVVSMRARMN